MEDKSKLFTSHGFSFRESGTQMVGICPFCTKENKFYVSKARGQFHCKSCGEKGNGYTFLQKFHQECLQSTKDKDYRSLGTQRGISPTTLREEALAYDSATKRWLIPIANGEATVANLMIFDPSLAKGQTRSTTGCKRHFYRANKIMPEGPIFVCEGEWDALALLSLREKLRIDISVVAVPGAETFKPEWVGYLKGRDVILIYDHDDSGYDGKAKVIQLIKEHVKGLASVHWPATCPKGYDLRDFISQNKNPRAAWAKLQQIIIDEKKGVGTVPKLKRTKFSAVLKDYQEVLSLTPSMVSSLKVLFAIVASTKVPGDPLWAFLVGPAGAGKSTMIQAFGNAQNCIFRSKLTATSFVSGMKQEDGSDPSLLSVLDDHNLFIKDYTAIKAMPLTVQEHLNGIIRDAYDGNVLVEYGNGVKRHYPHVHFSMIAGVTDIIHADSQAALGERFLKVEMISEEEYNPEEQIRASINNAVLQVKAEEKLKDTTEAFVYHLYQTLDLGKMPTCPQWVIERVVPLSQLVGILRASVIRERSNDLSYRPRAEVGTRIANQLIKLGICLAFVLDKKEIDKEVYVLMEKVAFDTAHGWHQDIVRELVSFPEGITLDKLSHRCQMSRSSCERRLHDLQDLRVISLSIQKKERGAGRPSYLWKLSDNMMSLWDRADVGRRR